MKLKNKYYIGTHISKRKFKEILKEFCLDSTVSETTLRTSISRKTIDGIFMLIRERIFILTIKNNQEKIADEMEIDESYFEAKRIRGKRGRDAKGKIPVFGILKRNGEMHTTIVKNCSKKSLFPIIKGKVLEGTRVYSDGWTPYDGLVYNYDHYRVYHSKDEFARGKNHINGIESFWSWSKRRLSKFNGIRNKHFPLHLKECEWRFNNRDRNIDKSLLKEFRNNPPRRSAKVL
jgi:transposase-like protein